MASSLSRPIDEPVDIINIIKCVWCGRGKDVDLMRLGCFHLGCKPCLRRYLIDVRNGADFHCPECDATCSDPEPGIEEFPLETLQATVKEIRDLVSNEYPQCSVCTAVSESTPSTHFCTTCHNHLCTRDSKGHPLGNNHSVVTHEELKTREVLSKLITSKNIPCQDHFSANDQQFLRFYCKKCKVSACSHCVILEHNDHDKVTIKEAGKEYKQKLKNKAAEINPAKDTVRENIRHLEETLRDVEEHCNNLTANFRKWGENMKKAIDKIVDENVEKIEKISEKQRRNTEKVLKNENNNIKKFENAGQYMNIVDQYGSDCDILNNFETYMTDLEKCLEHDDKFIISATKYVVKHENMKESEKCVKELFGEVYEEGSLSACDVKASWKARCSNGVTVKDGNILVVGDKDMELYGMNGEVKGKIECKELRGAYDVEVFNDEIYVSDNELREVLVMNENGRVTRRVGLPTKENGTTGDLGLGLDRNNGDMYICSWYTNTVYKCLQGESTATPFITEGLCSPHYLCVTSKSECIVSNIGSDTVCKFSPSGQLMWEYGRCGSGVSELSSPYGLCVDNSDNCFVADCNNHRIHYISPEGQLKFFVNIQEQIDYPWAVTFSNDTLIITQHFNTIRVIECKYKSLK